MKRILSLTIVLLELLVGGCGSGNKNQPPAPAHNSATRPAKSFHTPGAPSQPEGYKAALLKARRVIRADPNYTYVHAHLEIRFPRDKHCSWAVSSSGACWGTFLAGSAPFNNFGGNTQWEQFGAGKGPPDIPAVRDGGIKITQYTVRGRIECYVHDRSSSDCYTAGSQAGKPTGQEGGPLSLYAKLAGNPGYVFLHGFCQVGDRLCTPHP